MLLHSLSELALLERILQRGCSICCDMYFSARAGPQLSSQIIAQVGQGKATTGWGASVTIAPFTDSCQRKYPHATTLPSSLDRVLCFIPTTPDLPQPPLAKHTSAASVIPLLLSTSCSIMCALLETQQVMGAHCIRPLPS